MINLSEAYLREAYEKDKKSIYEIAEECETYPNKIRRALVKYKIPRRDKSEAQVNALQKGNHKHPTKGKKRSEEVKIKISEGMAKKWKEMSEQERERRINLAREQWNSMSEDEKEEFRKLATDAVRVAAIQGSKLERYILLNLKIIGYEALFHQENLLTREHLQVDILLPKERVAIEIDGPSHFYPIWGEDNLAKHLIADNTKTGLLLSMGYVVIRVKHLVKTLSKIHERNVLCKVIQALESIKKSFPEEGQRLIVIEIK